MTHVHEVDLRYTWNDIGEPVAFRATCSECGTTWESTLIENLGSNKPDKPPKGETLFAQIMFNSSVFSEEAANNLRSKIYPLAEHYGFFQQYQSGEWEGVVVPLHNVSYVQDILDLAGIDYVQV